MLIDDKADYDEHSCVFVKNYVDEKSILFKSKNDFLIISLGWGYRLSDFSVVIKKKFRMCQLWLGRQLFSPVLLAISNQPSRYVPIFLASQDALEVMGVTD